MYNKGSKESRKLFYIFTLINIKDKAQRNYLPACLPSRHIFNLKIILKDRFGKNAV